MRALVASKQYLRTRASPVGADKRSASVAAQNHQILAISSVDRAARLRVDPRAQPPPLATGRQFYLPAAPLKVGNICPQFLYLIPAGSQDHGQRPHGHQHSRSDCAADGGPLPADPAHGITQALLGLLGAPRGPLDRV